MATNNYFHSNYFGTSEQDLINGLMTECIQQQGYDMYYMPRETVNFDYLFGEDSHSNFNKTYKIEAYIKDYTGYAGNGQMLSKLGLDIQDELTIQISIDRFQEEITRNEEDIIRPREGDLMYFGLDKHTIMEITFVKNKTPFFQLGKLYLYEINLSRFVYGAQNIQTGIEEIDEVTSYGATTTILLGSTGTPQNRFISGEIAYQLNPDLITYRASGEVLEHTGNTLTIHNVFGTFQQGINIKGDTSMADYTFPIKNDTTYDDVSANKVADNVDIKEESINVVDTTESNPFVDF